MQNFAKKGVFAACFAALIVSSVAASYERIRGSAGISAARSVASKPSSMSEVISMAGKSAPSQMAAEIDQIAQEQIDQAQSEIEEIEDKQRNLMGLRRRADGSLYHNHHHRGPINTVNGASYIQTIPQSAYYIEPQQAMMPQIMQVPQVLQAEQQMYEAKPEFFGFFPEQQRPTPIVVVPTQNTTQVVGQRTHQQSRLKTRPTMINRPYTYDPQKLYAHDSSRLYNKPHQHHDGGSVYNKPRQYHDGGSVYNKPHQHTAAGQSGQLGQQQGQGQGQNQGQGQVQAQSFEQLAGPGIIGMPDSLAMGIPLSQQYAAAYPPQQFIPYGAQGVYQ